MIRVVETVPLTLLERYALDVLLDASRLLRTEASSLPATLVTIVEGAEPHSLHALRAADWGLASSPQAVAIFRGALRLIGRVLGLADEGQSAEADRHGRVPAAVNPLVREGLEREPVAARAAGRLRAAVAAVAGDRPYVEIAAWPDNRSWAVALTHDVDVLAGWPLFTALRVGELGAKGELARAARVLGAAVAHVATHPPLSGIREVIAAEERHGARSTWYFLCATPSLSTWRKGDVTYRPEGRAARRALDLVLRAGGEIGLHGSFASWLDAERLAAERERLARLAGGRVEGVRQHYLRARPGRTHVAMQQAGFRHDATMGFADRNGFRTGACDVFPAWNAASQAALDLQLMPLAWMDRAQSKYQGIEEPARWLADALQSAAIVRDAGGVWCGLWHPNLTAPLGFPDAVQTYGALCAALASDAPWFCTVGEAVAWRIRRRALRARRIAPDGTVEVAAPTPVTGVELRDRSGKPVPSVVVNAA